MTNTGQDIIYIDSSSNYAFKQFSDALEIQLGNARHASYPETVILCIGTDRSTGDSLGPLIGYKLSNANYNNAFVYGTLTHPVHAKNLIDTLQHIKTIHSNPFIIAIDACLGKIDHVGYITVSNGPIKPGAGTNKNLPEVGHVSVTGIVNFSGFMDFLVLQNTRLSVVMEMADLISLGIKYVLWKKSSSASPLQPSGHQDEWVGIDR